MYHLTISLYVSSLYLLLLLMLKKLDQPFKEDKKKLIFRQINFTWLIVLILAILAFTSRDLKNYQYGYLFPVTNCKNEKFNFVS